MNYEKNAKKIAKEMGLKMYILGKESKPHFSNEDNRDVYIVSLEKDGETYEFEFGQSIVHSKHLELSYATLPLNTYDKRFRKYGDFSEKIYQFEDDVKKDIEKIIGTKQFKSHKQRENYIKECFKIERIEGQKPTLYDVLACLTKYEVGSFEDFCDNFGYDNDSRSAYQTYKAVYNEFDNVERLFSSEEIEKLQEIE